MTWTKGALVQEAFAECGLAGYVFDLQPEEVQTGLRRMDAMLAEWEGQGIRLGYAYTGDPAAVDSDTASGIPDAAVATVYSSLAMRIAPTFGKTISNETRMTAQNGYDALMAKAVSDPPRIQLPGTMPLGTGNKRMYRRFVNQPVEQIAPGSDGVFGFDQNPTNTISP